MILCEDHTHRRAWCKECPYCRIAELEAELTKARELVLNNLYDGSERIAELEKELKWLQNQHVRVCSKEAEVMDRKYSDPEIWHISIDHDDAPDGSDGGYGKHGAYIPPEAMKEIVASRKLLIEKDEVIQRLREATK